MVRRAFLLASMVSCAAARPEVGVALAEYARHLGAMESHAVATSFTADGELVNGDEVIKGPPAIEAHLQKFSQYHVLQERMTAERTEVEGDDCTQAGTFAQRVTLPTGETVEASGRFLAHWRLTGGRWLLQRLETLPR